MAAALERDSSSGAIIDVFASELSLNTERPHGKGRLIFFPGLIRSLPIPLCLGSQTFNPSLDELDVLFGQTANI
jgi:hypothetical protein